MHKHMHMHMHMHGGAPNPNPNPDPVPNQAWSKSGEEGVLTTVIKALLEADEGKEDSLNALELLRSRWQGMISKLDAQGYLSLIHI